MSKLLLTILTSVSLFSTSTFAMHECDQERGSISRQQTKRKNLGLSLTEDFYPPIKEFFRNAILFSSLNVAIQDQKQPSIPVPQRKCENSEPPSLMEVHHPSLKEFFRRALLPNASIIAMLEKGPKPVNIPVLPVQQESFRNTISFSSLNLAIQEKDPKMWPSLTENLWDSLWQFLRPRAQSLVGKSCKQGHLHFLREQQKMRVIGMKEIYETLSIDGFYPSNGLFPPNPHNLKNLKILSCHGPLVTDDFLKPFGDLPHLSKVMLFGTNTTAAALSIFPKLTSLELMQDSLEGESIDRSLKSQCHFENLKNLTELTLERIDLISDESMKLFTTLTNLKLKYNSGITDESVKLLTNLKSLVLRNNEKITDESVKLLTNLNSLDLALQSGITDESVKLLTNLKSLVLCNNEKITDESVKHLTNLNSLDLALQPRITDESVKLLTNLNFLKLFSSYKITDESVKLLTNLNFLELSTLSTITDESVKVLTNLNSLTIFYNETITDESVKHLTNLNSLNIAYSKITDKSLKLLTNLTYLR